MQADTLFRICNMTAMIGWLLLTIAPRWRWTSVVVISGVIPLLLSAVYLYLVVRYFGTSEGGFGSLPEVMKLFTNEHAVLAGWIHYLAFDLFVGSWEVKDSHTHGISHWLMIPCLFLTFMLGPVGLIFYFIVRTVRTRKFLHEGSGIH